MEFQVLGLVAYPILADYMLHVAALKICHMVLPSWAATFHVVHA